MRWRVGISTVEAEAANAIVMGRQSERLPYNGCSR